MNLERPQAGTTAPVSLRVPDAPGMSRMVAVMAEGVAQRWGLNSAQAERFAATVEDAVLALTVIKPAEIAVSFEPTHDSIRTAIEPIGAKIGLFAQHQASLRTQLVELSDASVVVDLLPAGPGDTETGIRCHVGYRLLDAVPNDA